MNQFAICGVQMVVHYGHDNTDAMADQLNVVMLRFPWVEMVVFSELAAFGPSLPHAQPLPGPAEAKFCEMAKRHGIWLIPGTLFEKVGSTIYNTASVIDPSGRVIRRYRKMFPFRPYEAGVTAGSDFCVFDVPEVGRFGLSICYDMWFPETTRTLASMGAVMVLHPSLTNTVDRDVELAIVRASAAINQCYIMDVNGLHSGGYGRSTVVRPTGIVMYEAGSSPEMFPFHFNLGAATDGRSKGLFGLGQQLKSFRDRLVDFSVYRPDHESLSYLNGLGPLEIPARAVRPPSQEPPLT